MSATAWTVGRYVVETLAANGIDTVFGIPGVHNIELYRGLEFARLRHVLVRHEQNAGFAADGYARVSGCAAAAFVSSGPGVTNALTAVAQAYSDSVPLLVVASSPARACLGKGWGVLHELDDQRAIAAGVAGLARSARGAPDVRDHLRAAFATLHAARARPAYLEIPLDLLGEPTTLRPERFARSGAAPPPSPAALAAAPARAAPAARCASWWRRSTATSSPPWPARARWRRATPPASARVCRTPRPRSWWPPPTWWWRRARSCPKRTSTPPRAWR